MKKTQQELIDIFRTHLHYNSATGEFMWVEQRGKGRKRGWFKIPQTPSGKSMIQINKEGFNARIVAWVMHYGKAPSAPLRLIEGESLAISNIEEIVCPVRARRDFDREFLSEFLEYDGDSGKFRWIKKPSEFCADGWFSPKRTGDGAGAGLIQVFGCKYICTHIAWLLYWGVWPKHQIDHIDGNDQNHRIGNLRDVTHTVNMQNARIRKNNTTGVSGVSLIKKSGLFSVELYINGKKNRLGSYRTIEEAAAVRDRGCIELGFHANHGKR